mmetsp:Transcript_149230/g.479242  ORF Transcript_149230/g.479242 Transcript_149230/m.479242 type:complete len:158 (-) Transcript_149230:27-500(-)
MNALVGKAIATVGQAAAAVGASAPPRPPPPPPTVWCVTLRRKPVLTKEDEPLIGGCEKTCTQILLIPFALVAHLLGWLVTIVLYFLGCIVLPCVGPALFNLFILAKLAAIDEKKGKEVAQETAVQLRQAAGCAMCLVRSYIFVYKHMILPLSMLCDW